MVSVIQCKAKLRLQPRNFFLTLSMLQAYENLPVRKVKLKIEKCTILTKIQRLYAKRKYVTRCILSLSSLAALLYLPNPCGSDDAISGGSCCPGGYIFGLSAAYIMVAAAKKEET